MLATELPISGGLSLLVRPLLLGATVFLQGAAHGRLADV